MKGVHMQIAKMSIHRRGSSDRIPELNTRADAHNAHEGCQQANAKLIAAAPDLLEIASAILVRMDLEPVSAQFPASAMREDLRRAIAKATK